jgi:CubicO group peptidase (beta-lactamase class C family)
MRRFTCTLLALISVGSGERLPGQEPARPAADLARNEEVQSAIRLLEAWIDSQVAYRGLPGMSVAIVHDQDVIWSRGFGHANVANKVKTTPDTIYRIASISKVFTSTAIMQLRDQNKLRLDDPVEKHLPWFKIKDPHGNSQPVTIQHLLTHTGGLPREAAYPYWTDFKFPSRAELIKGLANQERIYPPDTSWKYSNLGLALAGEIVAAASGESFESYVQGHILDPLEMKSTSVQIGDERRPRLATGYGRRLPEGQRELRPDTDAKAIAPAAGLSSTVLDLARFASLQFRDGPADARKQILKGSTLREMHRVHWLMPDWKSGRGLGFHVVHRDDGDIVGHGGWVAGYQTSVYFQPKHKIAVIAMINADDGLPYPGMPNSVIDRAFQYVGPPIAKAAAPDTVHKARPEWQKYVGQYRNPWSDSQVLILNGKLMLINPTEHDPAGTLATLAPAGEHRFRLEGGAVSGPHGETVIFELDKEGKVARLKIGENFSLPVPGTRGD